jgi:Domain of unknown function (DUF4129)
MVGAVRGVAVVVVAISALGLVLIASRSGPTETVVSQTSPSASPTVTVTATVSLAPSSAAPARRAEPRLEWKVYAIVTVLTMALLIAAWLWLVVSRQELRRRLLYRRRVRRPRPAGPPPEPTVEQALAAAVESGLRRLEESEPRDAVVACWVLLERAAADAGTPRRPSETPAELTERVLAEHRVSAGPLDRLADLYRQARYSDRHLGEAARAEARAALERVRTELSADRVPL